MKYTVSPQALVVNDLSTYNMSIAQKKNKMFGFHWRQRTQGKNLSGVT